jgi:hypothetical protein
LLGGIANAAAEVGNDTTMAWLNARRDTVSKSRVTVGHTDLLAIPPNLSNPQSMT